MENGRISAEVLKQKIDKYVSDKLNDYYPPKISKPKVIHDSIHGTNIFYEHEIAFLDLPIIQKLRRISQTDVASYVFPAGNHNRFEHTVGVTAIAGDMVEAIFAKMSKEDESSLGLKKDYIYNNCRIAAILHDCGHGPFSHLSEQVYDCCFDEIKGEDPFKGASSHEILSYFIATSAALKKFNESHIRKEYGIDIDLDFVGHMIVGYIDKERNSNLGFVIEVINGAFDADKLDYILRDSHSTGIKMVLDLHRIMYTLAILKDKDGISRLAMGMSGVSALEEIVFNKMMLTSTIYHHQKVRAAGCVVKTILSNLPNVSNPAEFLLYTDDQIYNFKTQDVNTLDAIQMLENRTLPKRALCISSFTLENDSKKKFGNIMQELSRKEVQEVIIQNISERIEAEKGIEFDKQIVWIDVPKNPKFKEAMECPIISEGAENGYILLQEVFPTDDWVRAFSENKWQGFIFAQADYCGIVAEKAKDILKELFDIKFNQYASRSR